MAKQRAAQKSTPILPWKASQSSHGVTEIRIPYQRSTSWEWWALASSDWHWDSPKCSRPLLKEHLRLANKRSAAVLGFGDLGDLMSGKYDPRAAKDELRPEFLAGNYVDLVVDKMAEWLTPFAQNIALLSEGNHEQTHLERGETSIIGRLAEQLNDVDGANVLAGDYAGWVRFAFVQKRNTREDAVDQSVLLHFHHGVRGGGPNDMGELNQRAAECPDAHILVAGHTHSLGQRWISQTRVTKGNQIYKSDQLHLRCGGYKDDHELGTKGWSVRKGIRSKSLGSWWLRFSFCGRRNAVVFEPIPAM